MPERITEENMASSKRRIRSAAAAIAVAAALSCTASPARAIDTSYPPDGDNPLRIVYYFVAPVGTALEYTFTRPLAIMGHYVAPYEHIDRRGFSGCSRERPARSCTYVVK
jgi:hypothetical protein